MKAYLTEPIYDYKGMYAIFSLSRIEGKLYWRHLRHQVTINRDFSNHIKLDKDVLRRLECKKTYFEMLIPFREEDLQ